MQRLRLILFLCLSAIPAPAQHFVILGDRTGEVQPGVYEQILKQIAAEKPEFVVTVGDAIQGGNDATAEAEWKALPQLSGVTFYRAAGNHDIWSEASEKLFTKYAGHPPDYSFDRGGVHFTVLDNSRTEQFEPKEMAFLEADLKANNSKPIKVIVSHRPSWIVNVVLNNPDFEIQRLAKKYGVQYVIAGHVHKMAHAEIDGVTYISMPSAGGHLRDSGKYEDGWFFGYAVADVNGRGISIKFKEIGGKTTSLSDWGKSGLLEAIPHSR
jgi:predicted phosphodiesterase